MCKAGVAVCASSRAVFPPNVGRPKMPCVMVRMEKDRCVVDDVERKHGVFSGPRQKHVQGWVCQGQTSAVASAGQQTSTTRLSLAMVSFEIAC